MKKYIFIILFVFNEEIYFDNFLHVTLFWVIAGNGKALAGRMF